MTSLVGFLLPLGVGATISPMATAVCLMLLNTRRPLAKAVAFLIGYSTGLVAIGILSLVFFGGGGTADAGRSSAIKDTIDATFGIFFLVMALKIWLKAPDPNAPPPGWIDVIDTIGVGKALLFRIILMATNFSSLPLYLSGLKEIVTANIGILDGILVLALFILLVEIGLLVPIVAYALAPQRSSVVLGTVLQWIEKNNRITVSSFL
jgi:hypothetical protein